MAPAACWSAIINGFGYIPAVQLTIAIPSPCAAQVSACFVDDRAQAGLLQRPEHEDASESTTDDQSLALEVVSVWPICAASPSVLAELRSQLRIRHFYLGLVTDHGGVLRVRHDVRDDMVLVGGSTRL